MGSPSEARNHQFPLFCGQGAAFVALRIGGGLRQQCRSGPEPAPPRRRPRSRAARPRPARGAPRHPAGAKEGTDDPVLKDADSRSALLVP